MGNFFFGSPTTELSGRFGGFERMPSSELTLFDRLLDWIECIIWEDRKRVHSFELR